MGLLASFWLSNAWYPAVPVRTIRDINGVLLSMHDMVCIDCVVGDLLSTGFFTGNLVVTPINPGPNQPSITINSLSVRKP